MRISNLKKTAGAIAFGAALLITTGASAFAQNGYDPYYSNRDGHHQRDEKRSQKWHQRDEREDLKWHQREERDRYGNDADLRYHQREEREALKQHEKAEKRHLRRHQRHERDDDYWNRY